MLNVECPNCLLRDHRLSKVLCVQRLHELLRLAVKPHGVLPVLAQHLDDTFANLLGCWREGRRCGGGHHDCGAQQTVLVVLGASLFTWSLFYKLFCTARNVEHNFFPHLFYIRILNFQLFFCWYIVDP
jgi:hypothetical protein